MLKVMRESFKHLKWILVFIIFLFVLLVFVDWGGGGAPGQASSGGDGYIAQVNGHRIDLRDYDRALASAERNYEQLYRQPLTPEMIESLGLPRQVLNSLVDQHLLLAEADRLGLTATPEEVRQRIYELPVLNPDGKFVGSELYERYVTGALGFASAAEFEQRLGEEVTLTKLESAMANSVVIPAKAAEAEFRKRNENAKISYVLLPVERAAAQVTLSPAEVDAYYAANTARYSHGEQKRVKYLIADLARIRSQVTIPESTLRTTYDSSREQYRSGEAVRAQHILIKPLDQTPEAMTAAGVRAKEIHAKLVAGADFATLAKESSADPGSASQGGDLGFFERGRMVPEFETAAFSLAIGQLSEPVESQFGFHIIRVTEKREGGYKPFEEVRSQIEQRLATERAADQARDQIALAKVRAGQVKTKTDEALRALSTEDVSFNDSGWLSKGDAVPGIPSTPALASWIEGAKSGDVGEVIDTPRGPVLPWLAEIRHQGPTPLDEVRDRVLNDLRNQRARELVRKMLADAMSGGFETAGSQLGLTPAETTVSRGGFIQGFSGNPAALIDAALAASVGDTAGPVVVDQGAVAFRVLESKKFDPKAFEAEKDTLVDTIRMAEMRKLRASLLSERRRQANVITNEEVMRRYSKAPQQGG